MTDKKFIAALEENHSVYVDDKTGIEIENWTPGGVDQLTYLHACDGNYFEQYKQRIYEYDIDEEIDTMRQGKDYRDAFTMREAIEDYEAWVEGEKEFIASIEGKEYLPTQLLTDNDSYIDALQEAINQWTDADSMKKKQETMLAIGEIGYKIHKMNSQLELANASVE